MSTYKEILDHYIKNETLNNTITNYTKKYPGIESINDDVPFDKFWMFFGLLFDSSRTKEGAGYWEFFFNYFNGTGKGKIIYEWKHISEWLDEVVLTDDANNLLRELLTSAEMNYSGRFKYYYASSISMAVYMLLSVFYKQEENRGPYEKLQFIVKHDRNPNNFDD